MAHWTEPPPKRRMAHCHYARKKHGKDARSTRHCTIVVGPPLHKRSKVTHKRDNPKSNHSSPIDLKASWRTQGKPNATEPFSPTRVRARRPSTRTSQECLVNTRSIDQSPQNTDEHQLLHCRAWPIRSANPICTESDRIGSLMS